MVLRKSILLALALMLSACSAYAFGGPGSIVVDIVGSSTDNTKITSSGMDKVDLEIIGSEANNTIISPPEKHAKCPRHICPDLDYSDSTYTFEKTEKKEKRYPWENMHLGVDAWYGTFWYTDVNMPKWPQF
jgi:hypothetical protein